MKKKIKFINIHLFETEAICDYLHEMALQGWILKGTNLSYFTFVKREPQDLQYYMDIYTEGSYLNPYNIDKEQLDYMAFIEEYGYELIAKTTNFQIYRCTSPLIDIHSEAPLEQKKKRQRTIVKYELLNHGFSLLLALLFFVNPIFHNRYEAVLNNGRLCMMLFPSLFLLCCLLRVLPTLLWLIKKDHYHCRWETIQARERIYQFLWLVLMILAIFSIVLTQTSSSNVIFFLFFNALIFCGSFFFLDIVFSKFLKKYHGLLALVLSTFLFFMISNQFIFASFTTTQPSTDLTVPILSIQDFDSSIQPTGKQSVHETDSIFVHSVQYTEEYPATLIQEGKTYDVTYSFGYQIYTIHDTPFAQQVKDIILQHLGAATLMKECDAYSWYQTAQGQYIVKDNMIIELSLDHLEEAQISMILEKL